MVKSWNCLGMLSCNFYPAPKNSLVLTSPVLTSWKQIVDYIDQQFEHYFRDESGLNRRNIQDNRVHCCLYFISPFSHGYALSTHPIISSSSSSNIWQQLSCVSYSLRPLDVQCMKALHEKVNIIPVLAKADTLTQAEVYKKKMKVQRKGLQTHSVQYLAALCSPCSAYFCAYLCSGLL